MKILPAAFLSALLAVRIFAQATEPQEPAQPGYFDLVGKTPAETVASFEGISDCGAEYGLEWFI